MFVFDDKETGSSKSKADYITDFKGKEGDRIDLKLIDADTKKKGDQKFAFIGKEAFTKAGQVRYEKTKKETFVYLNTDNDKAAEAVIKLKGAIDLSKAGSCSSRRPARAAGNTNLEYRDGSPNGRPVVLGQAPKGGCPCARSKIFRPA